MELSTNTRVYGSKGTTTAHQHNNSNSTSQGKGTGDNPKLLGPYQVPGGTSQRLRATGAGGFICKSIHLQVLIFWAIGFRYMHRRATRSRGCPINFQVSIRYLCALYSVIRTAGPLARVATVLICKSEKKHCAF